MKSRIFIFLLLLFPMMMTAQEEPKKITVSEDEPFEENVVVKSKNNVEKGFLVKMEFNENDNQLRVFLYSTRKKDSRKYYPQWIKTDGIQPVLEKSYKTRGYIMQTYDVTGQRSQVSVTFRNLKYRRFFCKKRTISYDVTIKRSPCHGKHDEIVAANRQADAVKTAYETFITQMPDTVVASQEVVDAFNQLKSIMAAQFPANQNKSECDSIQDAYDRYNSYVKDIAARNVRLAPPSAEPEAAASVSAKTVAASSAKASAGGKDAGAKDSNRGGGTDPKFLLNSSRTVESLTIQWINSKNARERKDIYRQCQDAIDDVEELIKLRGLTDAKQKKAAETFKGAEKFFYSITSNSSVKLK